MNDNEVIAIYCASVCLCVSFIVYSVMSSDIPVGWKVFVAIVGLLTIPSGFRFGTKQNDKVDKQERENDG